MGIKSKVAGTDFEEHLVEMCLARRITCTQIPSGCRWIGPNRIKPVKSPWDFVLSHQGLSLYADAKSSSHAAFAYSDIDQDQIGALFPHAQAGIRAGYIIYLRKHHRIYFAPVQALRLMMPGDSLGPEDPRMLYLGNDKNPDLWDPRKIFYAPQAFAGHAKAP